MEPDKRYFEGKGLYRLVMDGLESVEDAERIQDAIKSGKHGKSSVWHRTWHNDDDDIPIPGTFAVYQRIMHDRDVASSEEEETRPKRSQREQRELKPQSRRLDDLNTKLNFHNRCSDRDGDILRRRVLILHRSTIRTRMLDGYACHRSVYNGLAVAPL